MRHHPAESQERPGVGHRLQSPARMTDTRRRVKVYTLNEDRQWDDRGTGHVSSGYVERLKGTSLLVRAESDGESGTEKTHVSNAHKHSRKAIKSCF